MPTIRSARIEDAPALTALLRLSVPISLREYTPLGQQGAEHWVLDRILRQDGHFRVIPGPGPAGLVAAAEWRHVDEALFLNNIAVTPSERGVGLGMRLVRDEVGRERAGAAVRLDVFDRAQRALSWYHRLGFSRIGRRMWWVFDLDDGPQSSKTGGSWTWSDRRTAEDNHARYGFSSLTLRTQGSTFTVGRLGDGYFRLTSPQSVRNPLVWTALREADPSRRVVYISPIDACPPPFTNANPIATSFRLSAERLDVLRALPTAPPHED